LSIDLGDARQAVEYYEQSMTPRRSVGDRRNEAITFNNLGNAWLELGESQVALSHYDRAMPIIQSLGARREEAYSLNGIASVNLRLGLMQKALEAFNEALAIMREVKNRRDEAGVLQNIGLVYHTSGDFQKALEHYQQALEIAREVGDQFREAKLLNQLGNLHRLLDEPELANQRLQQSLVIARAINSRSVEADLLNSLGSFHASQGEYQRAIDYYQSALTIWQAIDNRAREAVTLNHLGEAWGALKEWPKALELFQRALPLSQATGDWSGAATALFGLARSQSAQGDLAQALIQIEAALNIVESVRGNASSEEMRASFLASKRQLYEFRLTLLMQLHKQRPKDGFDAAALRASESARARTLVEILSESRAEIRQGTNAELLEREHRLRQRINDKAQQVARLHGNKQRGAQAEALNKEITALLIEHEQIQAQLRASSPRYAALTQPQPLSLNEIQQLLDANTILLEYALGQERSYLWAVTPTSLESYELPARAAIQAAAKRAYELLLKSNQRVFRAQSQLALAELSRTLLGPVANRLSNHRLLVVSDGALQYIPFAALPKPEVSRRTMGAGQPLIANHEIVSLPSASIIPVLRQETQRRQHATQGVAVFADPVFRDDDQRVRQAVAQNLKSETWHAAKTQLGASMLVRSAGETGVGELMRLPFTRQEAEAIAAASGAKDNFKALDFTASRATVTQAELSRYRILHFATHGLLNSQHPELSGLVLSLVDQNGQPQDGFLRLHDIYNLNLNAEMVVLSACRTALGKEVNGEGLIGLTRGFMFAGASRVVASLWDVRDEATAELMKRFYQKMLKDGQPPAAALRQAQISMLREKRWEAPYYWASFMLQGEWR
jgi:CHAT domain-containing protein/predicted negative regulator of RcsB-dependent stress response